MAGGRPKKERPFAWPIDDARARMESTYNWLNSPSLVPGASVPDDVRAFLFQLLDHVTALDEATSRRFATLIKVTERDESISDPARELMLMMMERHDLEDSSGRAQIRTLLSGAIFGKAPEPKRMQARGPTTPDGARADRPSPDALRSSRP